MGWGGAGGGSAGSWSGLCGGTASVLPKGEVAKGVLLLCGTTAVLHRRLCAALVAPRACAYRRLYEAYLQSDIAGARNGPGVPWVRLGA